MADYETDYQITVPIVGIAAEDAQTFEVQNVAGAFVYDDDAGTYTDYTEEANSAAAGDVPLFPGSPAVWDAFLVGGATRWDFVTFKIGTAGTTTYDTNFQYWNGSAWTNIDQYSMYVYDTLGGPEEAFKTTGLQRLTLRRSGMSDWAAQTIEGKSCYYIRFQYSVESMVVVPIADQIWLGTWSVAHTAEWTDSMAIDDTQAGQFYFSSNPAWSDNMAIDDTQAGQWSAVVNFVRSWSDVMDITDLTDSEGMQFQINLVFSDVMDLLDSSDLAIGGALHFARSFMDVMDIVDGLAWADAIEFSDILDITDQGLAFSIGLNLSDLMEIVDLGIREWGFAIEFQDIMTITDTLQWLGTYPAPIYLRFSARRPQITIYTKEAKKK